MRTRERESISNNILSCNVYVVRNVLGNCSKLTLLPVRETVFDIMKCSNNRAMISKGCRGSTLDKIFPFLTTKYGDNSTIECAV